MDNNNPVQPTPQTAPAVPNATPQAAPQGGATPNVTQAGGGSGGSKKMMLIIAGVVLLIIIVGGIYWFMNSQKKPVSAPVEQTSTQSQEDNLDADLNAIDVSSADAGLDSLDRDIQNL